MKTIKLDHQLAQLVLNGKKTATWRLYDDKGLSVNDKIEFIDKVDPQQPDTWKVFAHAVIDMIVEKRLGDIVEADLDGHERYTSNQEMIKTYQKYYGPQVDEQTPVKMIHFTLVDKGEAANKDVQNTSLPKEIKMYGDGGSRGNPGPSASGFVLKDMDGTTLIEKGVYLGVTTNNQAEYQALKLGLEEALRHGVQEVHVYMDSMLVVNQMLGIFKVKNRDLWPIHEAIKQHVAKFKHVSFTHVPRALNKEADAMVNQALDAQADAARNP